MIKKDNNFAYIDAANLYKGVDELGWKLNYKRFRIWLREKYSIQTAYFFIGLIPRYKDLYKYLQECGYTIVFKEVVYDGNNKPKGNCDADLVLQTVRDVYENNCQKALIVTNDGDYAGLVKFLQEKNKILSILSPSIENKCSILLKRIGINIIYLNDKKSILIDQKEKTPDRDKTL
ncbi:MAG: NYN domain-containing protein [Patescibacteria group bacterium]